MLYRVALNINSMDWIIKKPQVAATLNITALLLIGK